MKQSRGNDIKRNPIDNYKIECTKVGRISAVVAATCTAPRRIARFLRSQDYDRKSLAIGDFCCNEIGQHLLFPLRTCDAGKKSLAKGGARFRSTQLQTQRGTSKEKKDEKINIKTYNKVINRRAGR